MLPWRTIAPSSFLARGFNPYEARAKRSRTPHDLAAVRRKLILEISGHAPGPGLARPVAATSPAQEGKFRKGRFRNGHPAKPENNAGAASSGLRNSRTRELLRSEEHTSGLQSLMRIPYAVFCLKKKK